MTSPGEGLSPESGPGAAARRMARALTWCAAIAFWAVVLVLFLVVGMPLVDAILLGVLLAAVPFLAMAQVPLAEGLEIERLPAYWSSIATLWILGTACWFVGTREGGAGALGLVGLAPLPLATWTVALTGAGLGLIALFHGIARAARIMDSDLLHQLLPTTRREKGVFAILSLAAGTGEELAYRGYVIPVLAPILGIGGAALLSTVVFGVVDPKQGGRGHVRTPRQGGGRAWGVV
ncbi:MAG: CPBP family intramembrane glutamic endopeptidase, partial [Longimicrobiales bacterium]|nr:CPBP family intramembrane glutamic endopeptidase [Longimicrobiales bacterium]